jgi:hypothetical protein
MKNFICVALTLMLSGCASGPHLGQVTDVVPGELKIDDATYSVACRRFKLSSREARAFLNRAILVTPYDLHHGHLALQH